MGKLSTQICSASQLTPIQPVSIMEIWENNDVFEELIATELQQMYQKTEENCNNIAPVVNWSGVLIALKRRVEEDS